MKLQYADVGLSVSAGLAQTTFVRRGAFIRENGRQYEYERLQKQALGIPYEVQLTFGMDIIGFSISYFGNINRIESYGGFLLGIIVGHRY